MIHDLTANSDFHSDSFGILGRWRDIFDRANRVDELTPPDNEIVLTGSGFDREHKRYILDYESDTKNMESMCRYILMRIQNLDGCIMKMSSQFHILNIMMA